MHRLANSLLRTALPLLLAAALPGLDAWPNDADQALALLQQDPLVGHERLADGSWPLHAAVGAAQQAVVAMLLQSGVDPYLVDATGRHAAVDADASIARLIERRQGPVAASQVRRVRWSLGALAGPEDLELRILQDGDRFLDLPDGQGRSPLAQACALGDATLVQLLLEHQVRVDLEDRTGQAPIHHAARRGDPAIIGALLAAGASPEIADRRQQTPVLLACRAGRLAALQVLLAAGATLTPGTQSRIDPLVQATASGNWALIAELLERGLSPCRASQDGISALHAALRGRLALPLLDRLLPRCDPAQLAALVDQRGGLLHHAVDNGDLAVVQRLLRAGCDPSTVDHRGWNPLHHAARQAAPGLLRDLLADPRLAPLARLPDPHGWTAHDLAAEAGAQGNLAILEAAGIVGTRPAGIAHAVETLVSDDASALQDLLVVEPVLVTTALLDGERLLHRACAAAASDCVAVLLAAGAAVDARDDHGHEPLQHLLQVEDQARFATIMQMLLDAGARLDGADDRGRTVLDHAVRLPTAIQQLLRSKGAISGAERVERLRQANYGAEGF